MRMPSFSQERKLPPLRFSFDDFADLIKLIRGQVTGEQQPGCERLTVSTVDGRATTLDDGFDLSTLRAIKYPCHRAIYLLRAKGGPVSAVSLTWTDPFRTITVEGTDADKVEAVESVIVGRARRSRAWFGGMALRLFLGGGLWAASLGVLAYAASTKGKSSLLWFSFGLAINQLLIWPKWEKVLPGVSLLPGETSFVRRYAAEISAAGFVVGVVLGLIGIAVSVGE